MVKKKYNKNTGMGAIYEKCNNEKGNHSLLSFDEFFSKYKSNNINNINMKLNIIKNFIYKV